MRKGVAFVPGRFNPPHKGHINMFLWLLSIYDELIIGIGSCYEVGSPRHPLLAFFREKMIIWSLVNEGVDMGRVSFVHLQDFNNWDEWWKHINRVVSEKKVTHFVTGNEEDILGVMNKKKIIPPFAIVNPEKEMPEKYYFSYHATDLRNAINIGSYAFFRDIAAYGTIALMGNVGGFKGIREALNNVAPKFIPGRQTVDLIVTCKKKYVLTGYRKKQAKNFPGRLAIPGGKVEDYENPIDATLRECREETGLDIKVENRYLEPAHVVVDIRKRSIIAEMQFVGLFGTNNSELSGNRGGSSQVFLIDLDSDPVDFKGKLRAESDLERVAFRPVRKVINKTLAYQQTEMLKIALKI